jgi:hypothetical protein
MASLRVIWLNAHYFGIVVPSAQVQVSSVDSAASHIRQWEKPHTPKSAYICYRHPSELRFDQTAEDIAESNRQVEFYNTAIFWRFPRSREINVALRPYQDDKLACSLTAKYLKVQVRAWYVRANFVWAIVTVHGNTEYKSAMDTGYYTSAFIYSMYVPMSCAGANTDANTSRRSMIILRATSRCRKIRAQRHLLCSLRRATASGFNPTSENLCKKFLSSSPAPN